MKTFISLIIIFWGQQLTSQATFNNFKKSKISDQGQSSNINEFKKFVCLFFSEISKEDTLFLQHHIKFPIKKSDFGLFIAPNKKLTSISASYFYKHLKLFFPEDVILKAKKNGEYDIEPTVSPNYIFTFTTPLKDNDDLEESYRWFFSKKGNDFIFTDFVYDCN